MTYTPSIDIPKPRKFVSRVHACMANASRRKRPEKALIPFVSYVATLKETTAYAGNYQPSSQSTVRKHIVLTSVLLQRIYLNDLVILHRRTSAPSLFYCFQLLLHDCRSRRRGRDRDRHGGKELGGSDVLMTRYFKRKGSPEDPLRSPKTLRS
jgi:hypothetical protein